MTPDSHRKPEVSSYRDPLQPAIWPASLMLAAEKFPRAVITPSSHRKAYGFQEASRPVPTICPALLMSLGYVLTVPGRDPRSVMTPSAHRKAWVGSLQVPLIPTIWPASLMAVARLLSSPGSVPRSWIGSVADAEGATTNTPRSNARLATRTSAATILPMRTWTVPTPCILEIPLDPPATRFPLHR